jgi:prolipoprotein diacylglyceryltransferase
MIEAVFRYSIEYVRYYEQEMVTTLAGIEFTYNNLIAFSLFVLGLIIIIARRHDRVSTPSPGAT